MNDFPVTEQRQKRQRAFSQVDLYPVITEAFCEGRTSLEVLDAVLAAGVSIVQLREKHLSNRALYELALRFRERTAKAGALLIINDRLDIALAVEADGVHLGQGDLPCVAARKIAPHTLLGVSTLNLEQVGPAVSDGASYVNVGPVFATGTKPEHKTFLGPVGLAQLAPQVPLPFSTMGGIKLSNVGQVLSAGAKIIAVVTAVTAAPDVRQAAAALRDKIRSERK